MPPKNSGGSTKFPGGHKVIHRTAQTAFVRVVTPRSCVDKRFPVPFSEIVTDLSDVSGGIQCSLTHVILLT